LKPIALDKAYNDEGDADVKERILLVRRILTDKQHIESVAQELHKSRAWAYKWYKIHNDKRLDGLKDKPRSGRPPLVNKYLMIKIRKELEDSNTGWDFRQQVMNFIQKRTEV
jgi:putative transposase